MVEATAVSSPPSLDFDPDRLDAARKRNERARPNLATFRARFSGKVEIGQTGLTTPSVPVPEKDSHANPTDRTNEISHNTPPETSSNPGSTVPPLPFVGNLEIDDFLQSCNLPPTEDNSTRGLNIPPGAYSGVPMPFPTLSTSDAVSEPSTETSDELTIRESDFSTAKLDALDRLESFQFKNYENWYKSLPDPSMEQQIQYEAAKMREHKRKSRLEAQQALKEMDEAEERGVDATEDANHEDHDEEVNEMLNEESDQELFCAQEPTAESSSALSLHQTQQPSGKQPQTSNMAPGVSPAAPVKASRRTPKPKNKISAEERRDSIRPGLHPLLEKLERQNSPRQPRQTHRMSKVNVQNGNSVPNELSLHSNVVEEAHMSSLLGACPAMTGHNKRKALAQLIASIPTADQGQAKNDKKLLLDATRKFTHTPRLDGKGGWKTKGLKTSMYNYQLLGAAFMRDREHSSHPPFGGLLCDTMGFGKTFQALVNIVDGIPTDPDDPMKTTLLVVPSHLVKHWMDQMRLHCNLRSIGEVVEYHANSRISTLDPVTSLQNYRVVLTTYNEVRRSYPVFKPPREIADAEGVTAFCQDTFEKEAGPLHRIKFQRIVLDEAHIIKNRSSNVSQAVRGLTGKHKWLLSGTPIQNFNEEFYPLFEFLGVPNMLEYSEFVKFYCSNKTGQERLANLLRSFMYRRTHSSRLFNLPVINLPDIEEKIVKVKFCSAERLIYTAITEYFLDCINSLASVPNFKVAQSKCFLTMILRLRMFCSHLLTVQGTVKPLLDAGLMQDLTRLVRAADPEDASSKIIKWLKVIQKDYKKLVLERQEENEQQEQQQAGNQFFSDNQDLIDNFYQSMEDLHNRGEYHAAYNRSVCSKCFNPPDKEVVTSCLHLYCEECFCNLHHEGQKSESGKPLCLICRKPIQEATSCRVAEKLGSEKNSTPSPAASGRRRGGGSLPLGKSRNKKADNDDDECDWILACGSRMPGSKLLAIKDTITDWKKQRCDVKVVIFSQFLSFVRIVNDMCAKEGWNPTRLTGKMSIKAREQSLDNFRQKSEITVLIVSLHSGGTGLDMTAASKCILVDLWWNEAVQTQAFCRLLRHGQKRDVECVKLIVEDTIDDYLLETQSEKTENINNTMGEDALNNTEDTIKLMQMFGNVTEDEFGRITVESRAKTPKKRKLKGDLLGKEDTPSPTKNPKAPKAPKTTKTTKNPKAAFKSKTTKPAKVTKKSKAGAGDSVGDTNPTNTANPSTASNDTSTGITAPGASVSNHEHSMDVTNPDGTSMDSTNTFNKVNAENFADATHHTSTANHIGTDPTISMDTSGDKENTMLSTNADHPDTMDTSGDKEDILPTANTDPTGAMDTTGDRENTTPTTNTDSNDAMGFSSGKNTMSTAGIDPTDTMDTSNDQEDTIPSASTTDIANPSEAETERTAQTGDVMEIQDTSIAPKLNTGSNSKEEITRGEATGGETNTG